MSIEEIAKEIEQHLDSVAERVLAQRRGEVGDDSASTPEYWIGVCRAKLRLIVARHDVEVAELKGRLADAEGHPLTCEECGDHDGTRRADGRVLCRDCHVAREVDAMHAKLESESPGRYHRRLEAVLAGHPRPWEVE